MKCTIYQVTSKIRASARRKTRSDKTLKQHMILFLVILTRDQVHMIREKETSIAK